MTPAANVVPFPTEPSTPSAHNPWWLGQRLLDARRITRAQLDSAIAEYKRKPNTPFAQTLERLSLASQKLIAQTTAEHFGLPYSELPADKLSTALIQRLAPSRARNYIVIPFHDKAGLLTIAVADPSRYTIEEARHDFPGRAVTFLVAPRNDILSAIELAHTPRLTSNTPADTWTDILNDGVTKQASDIHVEQLPTDVRVRFRIDGAMTFRYLLGPNMKDAIIQAIITFAGLDYSQKLIPQDGQGRHIVGATTYNCRINVSPVIHGLNATIRLQDESRNFGSLPGFGLSDSQIALILRLISVPDGLFYVTGPTGSGKTTLLYALLATQDLSDKVVLTIEDPVEYVQPDYAQTPIDDSVGRTFAVMLRAAMRRDPDVILIGETRDPESASTAANAALTGHRIFSTVHTRTAIGAVTRMLELKVEPFVLTSALRCTIGTRLVKKLCTCRTLIRDPEALKFLSENYGSGDYYQQVGCEKCSNTGFFGRTAITEIFPLDDPSTQALILRKATTDEIAAHLKSLGYPSMRDDGLEKVHAGITTIQEVISQV